ncbi:hypothetical protein BDP27DRAFT_1289599 [Rhodocollybia butyracea]|uniref:UDP-Glycosyltransferase/glycogen phosphorylase n=1 Tax=Rhodocollybia butyracea TaxID=206335 RepID=A0A9P5UBH8_9AGAR|nr:hypothetical protein BDP27DRAFT_1289599 [Rhodocollybia butyracea]
MGSISNNQKHVVVHAFAFAWGHNKPLCAFVTRILEAQPETVVTYLTGSHLYSKIIAELKRLPSDQYEALESRLNVIDISEPTSDNDMMKPLDLFAPTFTALYTSASVTCNTSGKTISGLSCPTLAIIDPFTAYAYEAIRAVSGESVPILAWWTANAGSLLRVFGPPHLGGVVVPELETPEGRAETKKRIFAGENIQWHELVGNIVNIPGIDTSYDYEWFPQKTALTQLSALVEKMGSIYIREADGIICVSANAYEPEAIAKAEEWYTSMNKVWYTIGPLSMEAKPPQTSASESDPVVEAFLNRIHKEFGSKSLLYISFGTVFWPEMSDRIWAVIEGLIEKRQPFLFSHSSAFQQFPEERKKQIADCGIAMELPWVPQERILSHPVTGWFCTHGGWNSMQEAFLYRVPQIFWPFQADQPYNALRMTHIKAGFELVEVRTGVDGTRIPYKCKELPAFTDASCKAEIEDLVDRLRGNEGFIVRENFEAMADEIGQAWNMKDGSSRKDLNHLLDKFLA